MRKLNYFLIASFLITLTACKEQTANGQTVVSNASETHTNSNGYNSSDKSNTTGKSTSAENIVKKPIEKPYKNVIGLEHQINRNAKDMQARLKLNNILKWGNQCSSDLPDNEVSDPWKQDPKVGHIEFYPLTEKNFIIQIMCDNGMYNQSYYYYLYKEQKVLTVELLDFEMIEFFTSKLGKKNIIRNITNLSYSNPMFDEKRNLLKMYFKSTGYSGHEHTYKFVNGKALLIERTETNCDPDPRSICNPVRQNLTKLRKKAKTAHNFDFDSK